MEMELTRITRSFSLDTKETQIIEDNDEKTTKIMKSYTYFSYLCLSHFNKPNLTIIKVIHTFVGKNLDIPI